MTFWTGKRLDWLRLKACRISIVDGREECVTEGMDIHKKRKLCEYDKRISLNKLYLTER
jgi:hypothetical protein